MTATELLKIQLEDSAYQISQILNGFRDSDLDKKLAPSALSVRQHVEHLCEVYEAYLESVRGQKHEWGKSQVQYDSNDQLREILAQRIAEAHGAALNATSPEDIWKVHEYVIAHDYYHVGQMAAIRIAVDPSWNPYAIYRHS